jgi:hypothetical protein
VHAGVKVSNGKDDSSLDSPSVEIPGHVCARMSVSISEREIEIAGRV